MRIFLLILLALCVNCAVAQYAVRDSLMRIAKESRADTQKVNIFNRLFNFYSSSNLDSAQKYASAAHELSVKIDYWDGEIAAGNNLGTIYYLKGNNINALKYYIKSVDLLEGKSAGFSATPGGQKLLSSTYNNIGTIFQRQKLYDKAKLYFQKSITIDEKLEDMIGMAHSYNNIGTIYEETNDYDEAISNYETALRLKIKAKDTVGIASTLINMGVIRMNQNEFHEAGSYFNDALNMAVRDNNNQDKALALINLGDMYYLKKDYPNSIVYYKKGIEICKSQEYQQFLSYAYNSLALSYYKLKDFERAYDYYQNYVSIKDSLYNSENSKVIHELEAKYETESKEKEIKLLMSEAELHEVELRKNKMIIYVFIGGFVIVACFVSLLFRANFQRKRANQELNLKNKKIEVAYKIIEEKQKEIVDSINYAKRIQYTLLAHKDFLAAKLNEHFIFFKPKDIVSGDFYWAAEQDNKFFLAVCDSTGHGVPGAFMSLLSIGFLSEAINEKAIYKPNEVLNYVRKRLIENISVDGQKDGFDGILVCFDRSSKTISYAAAQNAPVIIENGNITHLPFDKMPVGIGEKKDDFKLYEVIFSPDSTLYLYSDGFADQFGGPKGKKYKYKQLDQLLLSLIPTPLSQQEELISAEFSNWKGNLEQVDDVCIIGIRL